MKINFTNHLVEITIVPKSTEAHSALDDNPDDVDIIRKLVQEIILTVERVVYNHERNHKG